MTSTGGASRPATEQGGREKNPPQPAEENAVSQPAEAAQKASSNGQPSKTRTRTDTTPRDEQNSTPDPWTRQAEPGPPPGPVPPPSLVGKKEPPASPNGPSSKASAGYAPPAVIADSPTLASGPPAAPMPTKPPEDTQASLEAVPIVEAPTPKPQPARAPSARRVGRVRKARLRLLRVDPWSVMKTAFLLSVALGITLFVAVAVLWSVLDAAGVFESVDGVITDMTASETNAGVNIKQYIELSRVLGFTTLIAVADVVLLTALVTLGAFLYNLSASLLGGIEVTLAEDD